MRLLWQIVIWSLRGLALLIVLGLSALLLFGAWTMHQQGIRLLGVQTGSMVPALHVGDAIVAKPQAVTKLETGDIIAYRDDQGFIISHRLRSIDAQTGTVTTQGDHNQQPDQAVPASQIIGKVQAVLPKLGRFTDALHRPIGLIGAVYVPATVCIVWQLRLLQLRLKEPYRLRG